MVDQYMRWIPDYPGQQPQNDPQFLRAFCQPAMQTRMQDNSQQQTQAQNTMSQPSAWGSQPQAQHSQGFVSDNSNIIWVSGAREAGSYPLAPNSAVEMRDTNNQFLYVKQRDASGRPNLEAYRLTPVDLSQPNPAPVQSSPRAEVEYVPRQDFDALTARCEAIEAELNAIRNKPCECTEKKEDTTDA